MINFDFNKTSNGLHIVLSKNVFAGQDFLLELKQKHSEIITRYCFGNDKHRSDFDAELNDLQSSKDKSIFITTMNPDVINMFGFENKEQVQERFIFVDENLNAMVLSDREAYDFYLSYDVGIQYVREILHCKGYW